MKLRHLAAIVAALAFAASLPLLAVAKGPVANGPGGYGAPGQVPGMPWGNYVNAAHCSGKLVVNVTFNVINDADSGYGGYWALDAYQKNLQIFDQGDGSFCAVARYIGTFATIGGASDPAKGGHTLPEGATGKMQGGYYATFDATLNPHPALPTHGPIGSFDYHGSITGVPLGDAFDWSGAYFTDFSNFEQPEWGWIYRTPHCGTWYNDSALPTGQGDIYCPAS
jgi:hypothetical protein